MQIPLDYYRVLGVPVQATAEQLEQAHRDRTLQLPRREYSEFAIQSRKQLIDQAYGLLKDPNKRAVYDSKLAPTAMASEAGGATIEIHEQQLIGALLILLELGEYELVIRLGRPYVSNGAANPSELGNTQAALSDIVLTLGLACLELGREQWQQRQFENAAESLETGQELMVREGLFLEIQAEIQADLNRLKPYRILELVARPLEDKAGRQQGIELLRTILDSRGGIEGANDDASGLGVEEFLQFVQQLRSYLTSSEQQALFEAEAQRPSAVGAYLSVYALLARGFATHQPSLVRRAKQRLTQLTERQDVYLEQAVCSVLLGQTEEATHALERSQEAEPIAFIQKNSQGAPDLLPGLCLYTERWLQQDVFPFFRDLSQKESTLKSYFADEQVQSYLESMPPEDGRFPSRPPSFSYAPVPTGPPPVMPPQPEAVDPQLAEVAEQVATLSPEGQLSRSPERRSGSRRSAASPKWGRLALVILLGLLCLGAVGVLLVQIISWLSGAFSGPRLQGEPLAIDLARPAIEIPAAESTTAAPDTSPEGIAETTIQNWYEAKAEAMGADWNTAALEEVLLDPALSQWQNRSRGSRRDGVYVEYDQSLEILSAETVDDDQIRATAQVSEVAQVYQAGSLDEEASYQDNDLTVEYLLERQGDRWLISSYEVL